MAATPLPQTPAVQVSPVVHALPSSHVPPLVGEQVPVAIVHVLQAPHAEPAFCHAPLESHSWGWVPLHFLAPGMQLPEQVPLALSHTFAQAEPLLCQTPFVSQVCG